MQKKYVLFLISLVVVAVSVYVLAFRSSGSEGAAAGMGPARGAGFAAPPAVVTAAPVQQGAFSVRAEFVGTLKGIAVAELYAKVSGPITKLYAETGDRVRAGQVLAQIDDAEARERVRQAEAALKMAEATLAQRDAALQVARTNAERTQTLFDKQLVSQQQQDALQAELLSAQAQRALAEAQIEQAKANLSTARLQLDHTRIEAPFSGVIGKRFLDLGSFATTSRPVFSIVDLSVIKTTIQLVDKDATRIEPGQTAVITSDAMPGEAFTARVARISPVFDPTTGTAEAEIEIANPDVRLRSGMLVRVSIAYRTEPTALLVPKSAVVQTERGAHVFVAEPQADSSWTARQVDVRVLGTSEEASQGMVAVEGTVDRGDQVITLGQESLRNGAPVRLGAPKAAGSSATPGALSYAE